MLILSLVYKKSSQEADKAMEAHIAWVAEGYDKGWFLASGRKQPRTGGVILAKGPRDAIEAFVASDPFMLEGIADYEITEVHLSRTAEGLEVLKG
ncbi:YciI family protein [Rhizobium halophytocola]|uniref:Uncharacterized protein YciI n=1 Tax=Rhizobium halophytocola TaxID=735519 RepID=A0ABS4DTG0_9HYPH|nr:YciI family protein [Rhizobium halophytocola]MBP1848914.1 uncharacterized protein YciI [Rhizobium halophytocola]